MLGDTAIAVHPNDDRYKVNNLLSFAKDKRKLTPRDSIFTASLPSIRS